MRFSIASIIALITPLTLAADSLEYKATPAGQVIKDGVKLRILPVGDSITVGYLSSDGNGYRLKLDEDLSANEVVFAGTVYGGNMSDGYYVRQQNRSYFHIPNSDKLQAAWSGKTIKYIADNVGPSLVQRPNIILLHAGTNDMNPNPAVSTEGNDPAAAAERLGTLIDQMITACPDATILVAQIVDTCSAEQEAATVAYQKLIPGIVEQRRNASHHVLAVDFAALGTGILRDDCIHPTDEGYRTMGDYWYDFIAQIPKDWVTQPIGDDPDRSKDEAARASKSLSTSGAMGLSSQSWVMVLMMQLIMTVSIMCQ
ncbi:GDSL-like Lipase/Acylhydrolase [Colletotrichum abscissum]|uniref:GDSL-like Lipase/Acylhydrolase n=1 Tax=Colletotrichum abscissum TaxID=1671311 RepID=A0A9P9XA67_9PEZI|nr:GDSL-like Lipase/Acylhydrolase [Colletotrichum abscissum]KAI3544900.1 GDSL-like Lipase/Acylhydrolase [Colletotrichum abscissum]KAK1521271.1 GDSL-like Lipase/Acylhydrolase [Colletotrichum abscissum]